MGHAVVRLGVALSLVLFSAPPSTPSKEACQPFVTDAVAVAERTYQTLLSPIEIAQAAIASPRMAVCVDASGNDPLGVSLAYQVRQAVAASHTLRLPTSKGACSISLQLVTFDPVTTPREYGQLTTIVAYVVLVNTYAGPIYLTQDVASVGKDRLVDEATSAVATLDRAVRFEAQRKGPW